MEKSFFCQWFKGFEKGLEIIGVGYRFNVQGQKLTINAGYSHPVKIDEPEGITFEVPNPNSIIVKGFDKTLTPSESFVLILDISLKLKLL